MSLTIYNLSGSNELKKFGTGSVSVSVFIDEHCHSICSSDIESCGYEILKFFNYNGLLDLVNDFNVLKESFLNKAKSPYFSSVLDKHGILSMALGTYLNGGYVALDIDEDNELPGKIHISFDNWSKVEINKAFKKAEDYITSFKNKRLSLCIKLIADVKEVCQQEGFPFKDPFEPPKKEKSEAEEPKQESSGFFEWLFNLFK